MTRPLIGYSVEKLEELFHSEGTSRETLTAIAHELSFRKTARARLLADLIRRTVIGISQPDPPVLVKTAETVAVGLVLPPLSSGGKGTSEATRSTPSAEAQFKDSAKAMEDTTARRPNYTDRPENLLDAWIALEVLSPQTYRREADLAGGARSNIIAIEQRLPWDAGPAQSKPQSKVFFNVVLGTLAAGPAFDALVDRFKDSRPDRPSVAGNIVLASILVDKNGIPAGDMPISISGFGWGFPKALAGSLKDLADWTKHEGTLIEGLRKQLPKDEQTRELAPLSLASLQQSFKWLVATLGLPQEHVAGPCFSVRVFLHYRASFVPDPLLLNSFFLGDLARARELARTGALPATLRAYLGAELPAAKFDLLNDMTALEEAVAPHMAPLGRWPTPVSHTPSLLQQAAVNLASRFHGRNGLLGVNGPPGTGKSTLLRDVVADNIVRRAHAMTAFAEPAKAFKVGYTERKGGVTQELHTVDPTLRGFEMVVVSSNNKAVENVSAELPGLGALPEASDLRYFSPLASELSQRDAWGMIAAVLGNGTNRSRFKKAFWSDGTMSFQAYLDRAANVPPVDDVPGLARECDAPQGAHEALDRWTHMRSAFVQLQEGIKARLSELESLRLALLQLPKLRATEQEAQQKHDDAVSECKAEQVRSSIATQQLDQARELAAHGASKVAMHAAASPGWVRQLFRTSDARGWKREHGKLVDNLARLNRHADQLGATAISLQGRVRDAMRAASAWAGEVQSGVDARKSAEERCSAVRVGSGAMAIDEHFHAMPHAPKQLTLPWLDEEIQDLRAQLFHRAMGVHKAFIDAAALPLRRNLKALMDANFSNIHARRAHLTADLWASLFLVVPVVSTTFASVERMLGKLPIGELGWILVDEAGQATPQSAVGALMRAKRAIVVGDPQQIEPVVSLPKVLTAAVMREFAVNPDRFAAPSASVQTLADDASDHGAVFQTAAGSRSVGAPLLVHRRCSSPMFEISNEIAYGGLMVQAKKPQPSAIREVLGPSHWIDVRGSAQEKFSPEEGAQCVALLRTLRGRNVAPDVYVVSPFVAVQDGLRRLIEADGVLDGWVQDPRAWIGERVGTVHTVQGREADAVIVVLGAPLQGQGGARAWAGHLPNLLNVATTRAKEAIYVVGNLDQWEAAGNFAVLSKHLR